MRAGAAQPPYCGASWCGETAAAPGQRGQSTHRGARGGGGASAIAHRRHLLRPPVTRVCAAGRPATTEEEEEEEEGEEEEQEEEEVGEEEARAGLEEEWPGPTVLCGVAARTPTRQPPGT